MPKFVDRCYFLTPTIGDGTLEIGAAFSPAFLTPDEAGAEDGDELHFVIEEGTDFEIAKGIYGGSPAELTRATVIRSKIGGVVGTTKMSLTGSARVRIIADSELLELLRPVLIVFEFNNGDSPLTTAMRSDFFIPFNMRILDWTLLLDASATVSIDLWQDTYANYPPDNADSITDGNNPATSGAVKNQGDTTGWSTADLIGGRCLRAAIETTSVAKRATLLLRCARALS